MDRSHRVVSIAFVIALLFPFPGAATQASAPQQVNSPNSYSNATFTVTYNPASCEGNLVEWPDSAKTALNFTFDILAGLINSSVPIAVSACYGPDDNPDTLAAAGPPANGGLFTKDELPALPLAGFNYPVTLANAITGVDNNGNEVEIEMTVNSSIAWEFNTAPGSATSTTYDFVSTALHELFHGLGFLDSFAVDNGVGRFGDDAGTPYIYDNFVVDAGGNRLIDLANNSAALANALQAGSGSVQWSGPNAVAANRNRRPTLFAPNPYSTGSSIGHLNDNDPENAGRLMNSATGQGPAARLPSAITLAILKDIGWSVNDAADFGDLPATYGSTTLAQDGARHIRSALQLGEAISTEADGVGNGDATTDSNDDGVIPIEIESWQDGADGASVQVTVAGGRGCLSAWIDWDNNGDFVGAGEQVLVMQPVNTGTANFSFDVPNGTIQEVGWSLFGRFRLVPDLDSDGNCNASEQVATAANGAVFGGEVEDYNWTVLTGGGPLQTYLPSILK